MGVLDKCYGFVAVAEQTGHDVQGDTLGESKSGESVCAYGRTPGAQFLRPAGPLG